MPIMGFANVRLCKRLLSHSRSYDEGSILCKTAFAKPTLRAIQASAHTALLTFELATASPASECLA